MHKILAVRCLFFFCCLGVTAGCGGEREAPFARKGELGTQTDALVANNGLSVNGLSVNGLSVNGLSVNGLSVNGLSTPAFHSWFNEDPPQRDTIMKYVVNCAVSDGQTRTYTNPETGLSYNWQGQFGLARDWSEGSPATIEEQQIITACLIAHSNKFGVQISISVLGKDSWGQLIPFTTQELTTYSRTEACFFGNAFNGEGLFAGKDRMSLRAYESTPRACGLSSANDTQECPPILHVDSCADHCTLDPTRRYYTQCTYGGVVYRPLNTRILPSDIYKCGDGVCQFTESCGTGSTYDDCGVDCGPC